MKWPLLWRSKADLREQRRVAEFEGLRYRAEHAEKIADSYECLLRAANARLDEERSARDEDRRQYAGDLQLERTRHDEFVRDFLERVTTPAASGGFSPHSRQSEELLPGVVDEAIEDWAGGDKRLRQMLENKAGILLRSGKDAAVVASMIQRGESPG